MRASSSRPTARFPRTVTLQSFALPWIIIAAAASAGTRDLSLEAHEVGTGDAQISNWETNYGSYDRDFNRSKKVLVTLHNVSRKPAPFAITVYFIAKPTIAPGSIGSDARALFIYDRREHAGEFGRDLEIRGAFSSRTLGANITHYQLAGVEYASGADMIGWIVVGYSQGQRFGVAASSQELLQVANGQSRQSFEQMIAAYEKDHPSTLSAANASFSEPAASTATRAPQSHAAPPLQQQAELITLTRPIEVTIAYGKTKLPAGTRLKVVARTAAGITAYYMGDTVFIPPDAVDGK